MESSLSQRHLQSTSTEKGDFQIYSHRSPAHRHPRRRPNPLHFTYTPTEKILACLVAILFALMCVSFIWAYFLFTSGCVVSVMPFTRQQSAHPNSESLRKPSLQAGPQVVELDRTQGSTRLTHSTKYLSYLPHSGFHNQRIAFENALVMSRILNRTLLVPPVRLGKGILTYYPFDHLYELVALQGKDGIGHCANVSSWKVLPTECSDYYDYTLVPWNWLMNITVLSDSQPMLNRWNMSDGWLASELGIMPSDVFSVKDRTAYQFRFVDADPVDMPGARFQEVVSTALLAQLPHRLIQVGTLFGSSRLRLREQDNIDFRSTVRKAMAFSNPTLLRLAESIKGKLGGVYLAAHVRLGDGPFERKARKNIRLSYWRLLHEELGLSEDLVLELESLYTNSSASTPPPLLHDPNAFHAPSPDVVQLPSSTSVHPQLHCRGQPRTDPRLSVLNLPFFISTDSPASHPHLALFMRTFPCTFFLSDFPEELAELERLKSGYDGLMLGSFIVAFLDGIVAGNAERVVGTDGSTFSQFVLDVLWRRYHGWEIVQRG